MTTDELKDDKAYGKAILLLHQVGGIFWTRPTRRLVINPYQMQVLCDAGLLPAANGEKKRGKKKSWSPTSSCR
jgi:hypothetical protein